MLHILDALEGWIHLKCASSGAIRRANTLVPHVLVNPQAPGQRNTKDISGIIPVDGALEEMLGVEGHALRKVYQVVRMKQGQLGTRQFHRQALHSERYCLTYHTRVVTQQEAVGLVGFAYSR